MRSADELQGGEQVRSAIVGVGRAGFRAIEGAEGEAVLAALPEIPLERKGEARLVPGRIDGITAIGDADDLLGADGGGESDLSGLDIDGVVHVPLQQQPIADHLLTAGADALPGQQVGAFEVASNDVVALGIGRFVEAGEGGAAVHSGRIERGLLRKGVREAGNQQGTHYGKWEYRPPETKGETG